MKVKKDADHLILRITVIKNVLLWETKRIDFLLRVVRCKVIRRDQLIFFRHVLMKVLIKTKTAEQFKSSSLIILILTLLKIKRKNPELSD
jgi:hypothetical protein